MYHKVLNMWYCDVVLAPRKPPPKTCLLKYSCIKTHVITKKQRYWSHQYLLMNYFFFSLFDMFIIFTTTKFYFITFIYVYHCYKLTYTQTIQWWVFTNITWYRIDINDLLWHNRFLLIIPVIICLVIFDGTAEPSIIINYFIRH